MAESDTLPHQSRTLKMAWRIRLSRWIIFFGLLLVVAIGAVGGVAISTLRDSVIANSERQLQNISSALAQQAEGTFGALALTQLGVIQQLQTFKITSAEVFEQRMSGYEIHAMLREAIKSVLPVDALILTNSQGKVINTSRDWHVLTDDVSGQEYFNVVKSNAISSPYAGLSPYISGPIRNPANGDLSFHVVQFVVGPNGEFYGLVIGVIKQRHFQKLFQDINLGSGSSIVLARRDGVALARYPHVESNTPLSFSSSPLFSDVLIKNNKGVVRLVSRFSGKERLIAGQNIADHAAAVTAALDLDIVLAEWRKAAGYMIGVAAMLVLVIVGMVVFCAWQITNQYFKQKLRLDAAINNMPHGLCMFDSRKRLVVCNDRYANMYQLPPELKTAGATHEAVIAHRILSGLMAGEVSDASVSQKLAELKALSPTEISHRIDKLSDGRLIRVTRGPIAGGGWVATHEDVTELERREASFRLLFEGNPLPMWVYDLGDLRFLAVNDAAVAYYGYSREQFLAMTLLDIRPSDEHEKLAKCVTEARGANQGEYIWRHRKSDGAEIEVAVYSQSMSYEEHSASLVVVVDVTERKQAERDRDRDRNFLNQIIENVPVMIAVKEATSRRFVLANHAVEAFWGVSRAGALGKTVHELFPEPQADMIDKIDDEVVRSDRPLILDAHPNLSPAGILRTVTSKRLAVRDHDGKPQYLISVVEDVTERKLAEERIAYLAHHDALTDLPNRMLFREELERSLKLVHRGQRLAVLYLDLDNFKVINDTLGHPVGDELLKIAAVRLRSCLRETDIVARLGGDEFAIIQTNIADPIDVIDLVTRIHEVLREPCEVDGHQLTTDTSIGIALAPDDATDPDQLLKNADLAMYGAKAEGRGKYRFFELAMDARIKERRTLEFDLRQAITCGGLDLYYQPLVNLRDNNISGCEALLRWRHPERGMISPVEFIPIAEDTGLIIPLGEWVLRTACDEATTWPDDIKVAVNVSPIQFKSGNFAQTVINALAASRLPASRLELEITEAVLIRDDEAALDVLHRLRGLGVRIVMDDFGTGYSSLSYLRRFPFDKIKIDRSFIKDIPEVDGSLSIVQAVVNIAKSRNITTTAEGVETEQQLDSLRALDCTEMQGYLFSPARPATEIKQLFLRRGDSAVSAA